MDMELFKVDFSVHARNDQRSTHSWDQAMVERLWKREHQFDGRRYFVERELILERSETRSMTSRAAASAM
jgi:hypothetical protein